MSFAANLNNFYTKTEFDLFTSKPLQTAVEAGSFIQFRPISILDADTIEFYVPSSDHYIDFSQTQLYLKLKVIDAATGADLTEDEAQCLCPVNNFIDSLFTHIAIELNNRSVTSPSNIYNYRSYFEKLLNYGQDSKNCHLQTSLYTPENEDDMEKLDGHGFKTRRSFMHKGCVELSGFLHTELSSQDKALINNTSVRFKLHRNKPEFSIKTRLIPPAVQNESTQAAAMRTLITTAANKQYKIVFTEAILTMRKMKVNPSIATAHQLVLSNNQTVKMPINRVDMKSFTVAKGSLNASFTNIHLGVMPRRVFIAMIDEKAATSKHLNPYKFDNFNLSSLRLYSDVIPDLPSINCNFERKEYLQAYNSMINACGINYTDNANAITRQLYPSSFCVFGYDLTADLTANEHHMSLPRSGSMGLELSFTKGLKEGINVLIYSEFDSFITIDKDRNIQTDFSC